MAGSTLASVLRVGLYGWVTSLWRLLKLLCQRHPPERPGEHRPSKGGCVVINHPAFVRPDPFLYSQGHLMAQGLAVTWDNPDITLFKAGAPVSSSVLEPATTYEVRARIWNNSLEAPVIDMPAHLSFLDFGVGTEPTPVGTVKVDVGVKGSPDQPAVATWLWTTPPTPGHYCLQVRLDPADDLEPANNLGQENTDVVAAQSPAVSTFTLRNNTRRERRYRFEVDAYEIPPLPRCDDAGVDAASRVERHRRERHRVPAGFVVRIDPPTPTLAPGASVTVTVTADPHLGFEGRQALNINAFHELGFAGGVTVVVTKEV